MNSDEAFKKWYETAGKDGVRLDGKDAWDACLAYMATQQEPFAWFIEAKDSADWCFSKTKEGVQLNAALMDADCKLTEPFKVYTHPAPAQPVRLSDSEINEAFDESMRVRPKDASNAETRRLFGRYIMDAMLAKGASHPASIQEAADLISQVTAVDEYGEDALIKAGELLMGVEAQPAVVQQEKIDAERYRFLRDHPFDLDADFVEKVEEGGSSLDSVIDAALQTAKDAGL